MRSQLLLVLIISFFLAGCSMQFGELFSPAGDATSPRGRLHRSDLQNGGTAVYGMDMPFPPLQLVNRNEVERFEKYYAKGSSKGFSDALERRAQFEPMIEEIFREHGLPLELISIAMVESLFRPDARSKHGALGLWQFVPSTARMYGLAITPRVDERKDPIKSTIAAARHLRDLYNMYGDWYLTIASYNSGPGHVNKAIKSAGTRDFFELVRLGKIRQETSEFVPRVLALAKISRDPAAYGYSEPVNVYAQASPKLQR